MREVHAGSVGVTHLFGLNVTCMRPRYGFFFRFFADLNRNRNTSLKSQAGFCVQFIYGIRSAGRPSDKVFLLERIALLQEPMKVKIYISFYFVVLFFI